jgi:hypothetical protein
MKLSRLLFVITLLFTWQKAAAQFEGDVFFDETDITVIAGEQVTVPALFFSGATAFGGVEFEISFDPAVIDLIDIVSPTGDFSGVFSVHQNNNGNYAIVVSNQNSLAGPIGSVPLVNLVFEAVSVAGESTQLQATVRDSVDPNLVRFPPSAGFTSTVTVE